MCLKMLLLFKEIPGVISLQRSVLWLLLFYNIVTKEQREDVGLQVNFKVKRQISVPYQLDIKNSADLWQCDSLKYIGYYFLNSQ